MDLKDHQAVKKAVWAGRRLTELEEAVKEYSDKRPFTVRRRPQQKLEWELVLTDEIPEKIGPRASGVYRPDEICPNRISAYG